MDVGNDPFPRDEVTGLAAFENLEPVSTVSVLPPEPEPTPPPPPATRPPPIPGQARPQSTPAPPVRSAARDEIAEFDDDEVDEEQPVTAERRSPRADKTIPLDLTAEPPSPDDQFDASAAAPGWDDPEEATRVATSAVVAGGGSAERPAAALDMDWDEDEPPTRMRGEGMLDMPPLSMPSDWDEGAGEAPSAAYESHATSAFQPAGTTMTGGRPSPFPPAPQPLAARSESLGAPSPFTTELDEPEERSSWLERLKSGDRPTWMWAGAAALGVIVLALIVRALSGSTPGTLTVTTTPAESTVLVDGKPIAGTSSPYSMSEVAAGQHELIVRKSGFVDYRAMFNVGKGETKSLPAVELVPSVKEVGFSIRSAPPGAEVWVDGRATDQVTPGKLTGVNPGIHRLQLKRSGYADYELQFFVPDNTLLQLPTAELVAADTASAPAAPVSPREAREAKRAAAAAADDDDDQSAADKRRERLERRAAKKAAAASSSSSRSSSSASPSARASRTSSTPSPAVQIAPPPMQQAAPAGNGKMGTLRINSRPWAQVTVDGRPVGNTPQPNLMLPAGNHKVVLSNPPMGLTKSFSVTIKAGQMVTKVMNLAE